MLNEVNVFRHFTFLLVKKLIIILDGIYNAHNQILYALRKLL